MKLQELLERYPWDQEWQKHAPIRQDSWKPETFKTIKPLEALWTFSVNLPLGALWSEISDTSKTNRALGLPSMKLTEHEGILFGESSAAGWKMEWEDIPWEWVYGQELSNARIYSSGPGYFVRAYYVFEPGSDSQQTVINIYFGWLPRNALGRLFLKAGFNVLRARYAALLKKIEKQHTEQSATSGRTKLDDLLPAGDPFHYDPSTLSRIVNIQDKLKGIVPSTLLTDMFKYFEQADDGEIDRIRPNPLAASMHTDPDTMLRALLHLTRQGALTLSWDVICPHCRGIRQSLPTLGDLPEEASCDACSIEFDATAYNALEITFHLHPSIRRVEKRFYCSAEPARKPHIVLQTGIDPDATRIVPLSLQVGDYTIRWKGEPDSGLLQAVTTSAPSEIIVENVIQTAEMKVCVPGQMQVFNRTGQKRVLILEERKDSRDLLRPGELFRHQDFRDLFSEEALKPGLQLNIGNQHLLMTDLVGSTKLYDTEGDAAAFRSVKQHFEIGFAEVRKHGGAVVKTIGDALFAVLPSRLALVQTAFEIQKAFEQHPLKLRIAIQSGPVLAVNLNTGIDYFGNTVNLLAKLEGALEAKEIGMPASLYESPEIRDFLSANASPPVFRELRFSWKESGLRIAAVKLA